MPSAAASIAHAPQPPAGDVRDPAWRRARSAEAIAGAHRRVLPPDEMLPPADWRGCWTPNDKHCVVSAVRIGQISYTDARERYGLSFEEFSQWWNLYRDGPKLTSCMVERRVLVEEVRQWLGPD